MAKVLLGVSLTDARGACASVVFTKSGYGNLIRAKAIPSQPDTQEQKTIKGTTSGLAKAWSMTLSETQRSGWIALAAAQPKTDQLAQTYYVPGEAFFIGANGALHAIGVAPNLDAPPTWSAGSPVSITGNWNDITHVLTVAVTTNPGTYDVPVIWASKMLRVGQKSGARKLKALEYWPANTPGPYDITTSYQARFGPFIPLRGILLGCRYTDNRSGRQGTIALGQVLLVP
jgi:hypothetical protein